MMTMSGHYVVEVEAALHRDVKRGVLAGPRGLTGSRYPSLGRIGPATADWNDQAHTAFRHVVLGGPTFTTVIVSADEVDNDQQAVLLACQMAACTSGGMPTSAALISWPT